MPYTEHEQFIKPEDENIKIWRYMDLAKFISILANNSLFFTRSDGFEDDFEGSWPKINFEEEKERIILRNQFEKPFLKEDTSHYQHLPKYIGINCWHMNNNESAAMWKLYLKSDEGIAIQSTYKLLQTSILDEENVYLGIVKYIDFQNERLDPQNSLNLYLHKRTSFKHEDELRGIIVKMPERVTRQNMSVGYDYNEETIKGGVNIKIDTSTLIEKVYVAPTSPSWYLDLINSIIKKYGHSFDAVNSEINGEPLR